jgi:hypothetical protein
MSGRYDEPNQPAPDPLLINHYLWVADPKNCEPESERAQAVDAIFTLYRIQREEFSHGARPYIDPALQLFVREELQRSVILPDPLGAIERLLERKRSRGRPRTPHRDFIIAGDVAEKVESGLTVDQACADLVDVTRLSFEQIRRIYFDQKQADQTSLEMDLIRRKAERNAKS